MSLIWASSTPAVKAHGLLLVLLGLPLVVNVPTNVNIILSAAITVYAGSWRSVKTTPPAETMTKRDAARFPIIGSAVLFSLFLAFKFLPKEIVNALLATYFGALAMVVLTCAVLPYAEKVFPEALRSHNIPLPKIKIPHVWDNTDASNPAHATIPGIACTVFSAAFCSWYFAKKHWFANNILGVAFSLEGIEQISLGSVQVGVILLVGLFFYDIFWVFCTPVMVSVAKNFDAPIKLLFPRPALEGETQQFSMLGLGDIVIPGIFVALMLRYDAERNFRAGYFRSVFVGYTVGLGVTIFVMNYFQAAQPALLYIVPSVLGFLALHALQRGEFKQVWMYGESKSGDGGSDKPVSQDEAKKSK